MIAWFGSASCRPALSALRLGPDWPGPRVSVFARSTVDEPRICVAPLLTIA